jgi:hypothetical protein
MGGNMVRKSETKLVKNEEKYIVLLPQYLELLKSLTAKFKLVKNVYIEVA